MLKNESYNPPTSPNELKDLMDKVANYVPTWKDMRLEFTPEEKLLLGIKVEEEKNNDRKG